MTEPLTPGLHSGLDEAIYHADPALSASGAKLLVPPSTPAHFDHNRKHPQPRKAEFEFGHAAHFLVLGAGKGVVEVPAKLLSSDGGIRSNEAKAFRDDNQKAGRTVLKPGEFAQVKAMAEKLRQHPIAGRLFDPERGKPEQSIVWDDPEHGIRRRARLDWLPNPQPSGRLIVVDYKTAVSANPWKWIKAGCDYGVHIQHANYVDAVKAAGIAEDVALVFVIQEKTAPYLVSVVEVEHEDVVRGQMLMNYAARVFAECTSTNTWPGYGDDITVVSLPGYYRHQLEVELPDVF